ncbi:3-hydroxyacyl-[acyl-carrier-protein] dehydratase FabZ [Thiohalobacter thiocyanaticus]|uniref:3-hydroxyacyl-[acyl-carrier-protein] dehydratase FabZ n=2 Tax=Thiohalobacter thiocyanaticus TaxID=585455 RepID=A0A426QE68_9GAMM|nr:3-hydroxyacyl-[acyl-carrier-protein] dehydratase FabZ [Thiohalobacter thiocyanaticus]
MDINEIMRELPHRYPFLLIDRVIEYVAGEHLVGYKNVSFNEPFFNGHFPEKPIMPGVLVIEALAQATGLLAFRSMGREGRRDNVLYYLVGVDKARFKRPVEPGDQLMLHVRVKTTRRGIWMFEAEARVDGKVAASAELMCTEREAEA